MKTVVSPDPFDPSAGFTIQVSGGAPPYQFVPVPAPPNPPGVEVDPQGAAALVTVPVGTPPGTTVHVTVRDSSGPPPKEVTVSATTR